MKLIKQTSAFLLAVFITLCIIPAMASEISVPTVEIDAPGSACAGSAIDVGVKITSNLDIAKAEIYVNNVFHSLIHNPDVEFTFEYIVPRAMSDDITFKVIACDTNGSTGTSNESQTSVTADSGTVISFKDVPEKSAYDKFTQFTAEISDNDGIADIELYVNGVLSDVSYTNEGDVYTFTGFNKNLGDMNLELAVTDLGGVVTSARTKTYLENYYLTTLFSSTMDAVPGGSFKINAANGYSFGVDKYTRSDGTENKYMKISRPTATDNKTTYFRYQVRDAYGNLSGVFELEYDIKFGEGFENILLNFNPRGNKEPLTPVISGNTIELKNGTDASKTKTITNAFKSDTWYNLRYVIDTVGKTYRFFVDDIELTSDASPYALPLAASDVMGSMIYICNNIRLPDSTDTLGIDNVKYSYEKTIGSIGEVTCLDGTVSAIVADGITPSSLEGKVALVKDGIEAELSSVSYDESTKTLTVVTKYALASASEYQLVLKSGIINGEGKVLSDDAVKSFNTQPGDFDIVSLDFDNYAKGTGVCAKLTNNTDSVKTAFMLMTVKNANGAVESVYSSETLILNPGDKDIPLQIAPVHTEGKTVEVFFLDGWASNKAIKKYVYKNNK